MAEILKVSAHSRSTAVAGAVAGTLREQDSVTLQAIGAGAVNQMLKALVIARSFLVENDLDLFVVPMFWDVQVDGMDKTAMRLYVETRQRESVPAALRVALREKVVRAELAEDGADKVDGMVRGRVWTEVVEEE